MGIQRAWETGQWVWKGKVESREKGNRRKELLEGGNMGSRNKKVKSHAGMLEDF